MPNDETFPGWEQLHTRSSEANAMQFLFQQLMMGTWTATLVQVKAVTNTGALAAVGFCDVSPMIHQIDGDGKNVTPHGVINNLPYFRYQGGANAIILDPQVNDIGMMVCASRDISAVKVAKKPSVPGSYRQFDPSDGLYLGGFLNGVPTQFVRFSTTGIEIVSPTQIRLQAPDIQFVGPTHTTGAVTGDTTAVYAGEVTANGGHTVSAHHHGGVQIGGGNTGTPVG